MGRHMYVNAFGFYMNKHPNEAIIIRDGSQTFKWMLAFILLKWIWLFFWPRNLGSHVWLSCHSPHLFHSFILSFFFWIRRAIDQMDTSFTCTFLLLSNFFSFRSVLFLVWKSVFVSSACNCNSILPNQRYLLPQIETETKKSKRKSGHLFAKIYAKCVCLCVCVACMFAFLVDDNMMTAEWKPLW